MIHYSISSKKKSQRLTSSEMQTLEEQESEMRFSMEIRSEGYFEVQVTLF